MSTLVRWVATSSLLISFYTSAQQAPQTAATPAATTTQASSQTTTPAATTAPAPSEKPGYIVDSLSTALRSGPGNEYRTVATIRSGEAVTVIGDNPANGFLKIRDIQGNEGWLAGDYVTFTASPKANLEALKQQLSQQEMMVAQFDQERQQLQAAVTKAEAERDEAVKNAELAKKTAEQLTARLAEENPELLNNKMVIGGGILGAGILFGLILPAIMPRRRRNDRWM